MNSLREALCEYLAMRRSLGFKLKAVGNRLLNFVSFMERVTAPLTSHRRGRLPGLSKPGMRGRRGLRNG